MYCGVQNLVINICYIANKSNLIPGMNQPSAQGIENNGCPHVTYMGFALNGCATNINGYFAGLNWYKFVNAAG